MEERYDDILRTVDGSRVLSYEYVDHLRKSEQANCITPQKGSQEKFLSSNADITIYGGSRGGGKAIIFNSLVCTPYGFRKIQDLKAGDIITGLDGGMQRVLYNSYQGFKECVRLKFIDGDYVDCCVEHLWTIRRSNYCSKKRSMYKLPLEADWKVWTTEMIVNHIDKQKGKKQPQHISVPICKPVRFTVAHRGYKPQIPAYFLGVIIGDGCITDSMSCSAEVCNPDNEIFDRISELGFDPYSTRDVGCAIKYRYKDSRIDEDLEYFGLNGKHSYEKFIPDYYKTASVDDRFELLRGLMDTDGTTDGRGHCSFTTTSERLANDVKYLVNSLGGLATITKGKSGYKDADGNLVECRDSYDIYIRMEDSERMFHVKRKKERCTPYNGGISVYSRKIVGYERLGMMECCCIAVSNYDSLYLTNGFVATHNSFGLLFEAVKDIENPKFNAVILRNEKPDLENIINESNNIYSQYGEYKRSKDMMVWDFNNGGSLYFTHFAGSDNDFITRFQGKQYSYIGIDEITHISYKKFKYLMTCNRNAYGIRNRSYGTCNPDPESWVRKFIDYWIDDDGDPIPERDGVIRYCFMDGDTVDDITWGDTPEEVYEKKKDVIDGLWKPAYEALGFDKVTMYVKSATFIYGKLEENVKLLKSDPNYVANLANQDEERRLRDLGGNWNFVRVGDDKIKSTDIEKMFGNAVDITDRTRYVSADIAFDGGDFMIMWLWEGLHIKDIFVAQGSSADIEGMFSSKIAEWGVREENVVFDFWGVGQAIAGHHKRAVKFTGTAKPEPPFDKSFKNVKSLCADLLASYIIDGRISIEPRLLGLRFSKKGKYKNMTLREILSKERKCVRHKDNSNIGGFELINKENMIKVVGWSPDFFESLIYRMIFENMKKKHVPATPFSFVSSASRQKSGMGIRGLGNFKQMHTL